MVPPPPPRRAPAAGPGAAAQRVRLSAPRSGKGDGTPAVAYRASAPRACKWPGSVPAAQKNATDRARERENAKYCSSTVARREKEGESGIKYEIVGIEYVIEIIRVREK